MVLDLVAALDLVHHLADHLLCHGLQKIYINNRGSPLQDPELKSPCMMQCHNSFRMVSVVIRYFPIRVMSAF